MLKLACFLTKNFLCFIRVTTITNDNINIPCVVYIIYCD